MANYTYHTDWVDYDGDPDKTHYFQGSRRSCREKARKKSKDFGSAYVVAKDGYTPIGHELYEHGYKAGQEGIVC